ncbi:NAD(+) diphosphatase [Pseudohongiella spirulinae]|uniref:NAD(+) diphosphatase n=1 Tax=Pseudohongiella spirulinae TaxID=1249552 RepID=A0A0S2KDP4_9GAMM|nr:NAD(+) diphosphatase [Pseudohongiella spirulinae]ALO46111.1 NADH pyrophosphatase [Pseudohongiella spirulinae]
MPAAVILLYQGKVILNGQQFLWPADICQTRQLDVESVLPVDGVFGHDDACQLVQLESLCNLDGAEPISVRNFLLDNGFEAFSLLGRASQLSHWYMTHRYCGACGAATTIAESGRFLSCADCGREYYPRINPCIIVLVTRGEQVLLARSSRPGADFYSCLAGFIEPGESAEEAVAREVYEEVGIRIHNIRYVRSQPWPFPSQLMLAYYADYLDGEITPCPEELSDAAWFSVDHLPRIPSAAISVAGQLIEQFVQRINAIKGD